MKDRERQRERGQEGERVRGEEEHKEEEGLLHKKPGRLEHIYHNRFGVAEGVRGQKRAWNRRFHNSELTGAGGNSVPL